jgi:uncharacterized membrane protein YfcA
MSSQSILLAALILIAASLYSTVGHGGASGYLAAMALFGLAPEVMRPTALVLNLLVAAISSVQFARAGYFRSRLFWPFAAASIPLAFLGGRLTLPAPVYRQLLGFVLLFAAYRLFLSPRTGQDSEIRLMPLPLAVAIGGAIGLLSGLTGVGGGIFLSPILLVGRFAPPRETAAVSGAFIWVNSLAGLLGRFTSVSSLPAPVPLWAIAAVVGGLVGAHYGSRRLAGATLRRLLAIVLVVAAVKLVLT